MGYSVFDETMVDMSWPDIEAAAARDTTVLLPVGIIEEHGPHLNLGVDTYAACLIAKKARRILFKQNMETLIAPPQYWGISRATAVFGGTFSIKPETMQALIVDIMENLNRWGFKRVFTVNWHADLEHCRTLLSAVQQSRQETGMDVRYVASEFDLRRLKLNGDEDSVLVERNAPPIDTGSGPYADIHAGSMETGVMLRFFPEGIDRGYVKTLKPTRLTMGDLKRFGQSDEETRRMVPNGYFGNPAGFNMSDAETYVEAVAKSYAETVATYLKSIG